ncbi:MAG TPA: class I SAM-dependent methyltransferase [Vicinamibacterales bacterium]|nr:class I SAM-dependent methyltransferase [Vicinamibacterales bacterium]
MAGTPGERVGQANELTSVTHWDDVWAGNVRMSLPSPWIIATRNLQRLLRPRVRPGDRFLEIGCAPGKMLAWVAAELGAQVSGLDYSERGLATARRLFSALGLQADFRCEDLRATTYAEGSFDIVLSVGVIEHFDDPRDVVREHLRLLAPGGTALMTVPNYGGIYGRLQAYFDPELLALHNLDVMTCDALRALVPADDAAEVCAFPSGRLSPWVIGMTRRWPAPVIQAVGHLANAAAILQPVDIPALCPMLVLEVKRAKRVVV